MKLKKTRAYDNRARLAKAEERKRRIMLCTAELYREKAIGDITLEDVATRAETTVQTILRAFGSRSALVLASIYEISLEGGTDKPMRHATSDDVPGTVRAMFDLYEMVGDVVIRRLADAPQVPDLREGNERGRHDHLEWVRDIFAPDLARLAEPDRTELFNALVAATDLYIWQILMRDQKLDRPLAEAVVVRMIEGLIGRGGR